jgi:hypothetical protein
MYAKKPATKEVAASNASAMKLWLVKASVNSPSRARTVPLHRANTVQRFVHQSETKTSTGAHKDNHASSRGSHLGAQNKVLVIMDDAIFRKQAYRGTGCEKGSSEEVTVSIHACAGGPTAGIPTWPPGQAGGQIGRNIWVPLNWTFEMRAQGAPDA